MGGVLKGGAIGSIFGPAGTSIGATIGGIKGLMAGKQGSYYNPAPMPEFDEQIDDPRASAAYKDIAGRQEFSGRGDIAEALGRYGQGQSDLSQALGAGASNQAQMQELLATNPLAAGRLASDQVSQDSILGRLYGAGGDSALGRALQEEKDLGTKGWSMTPQDQEAYGQASDEIARTSGAQEKMLANALAGRGLAQSGDASARSFSGLMGNKFEQLAGAQRRIAQDRMNTNMQRIQNVRNYAQSLGQGAENAISNRRDANMRGVGMQQGQRQQGYQNEANAASDINAQRRAINSQKLARWTGQQEAQQASQRDMRDAYEPGFGDAFKSGLMSSFSNIGAAPGKLVTSAAGRLGSGGMGG